MQPYSSDLRQKIVDAYIAKAIEAVIEAKVPRVSIDVQETNGTADNLKQIEANKVDLATAQADVPAGGIARTVAILYSEWTVCLFFTGCPTLWTRGKRLHVHR